MDFLSQLSPVNFSILKQSSYVQNAELTKGRTGRQYSDLKVR